MTFARHQWQHERRCTTELNSVAEHWPLTSSLHHCHSLTTSPVLPPTHSITNSTNIIIRSSSIVILIISSSSSIIVIIIISSIIIIISSISIIISSSSSIIFIDIIIVIIIIIVISIKSLLAILTTRFRHVILS